jgi:hypothetical protein
MPRLLVVPHLPVPLSEGDAERRAQLPAMPALCELLRLGDPCNAEVDWRRGVASDLGMPKLGNVAPASIVACLLPELTAGSPVCMANPVHAVAGMSRVHLHPAGVLVLDPGQSDEFCAAFVREFGAAGAQLRAVAGGLVLAASFAAAVDAGDPVAHIGMPLERKPADSSGQRELRRFGAEVEMWLHDLPLNRERTRHGELAINSLWFWGGGEVWPLLHSVADAPAQRDESMPPAASVSDPWLRALCHLQSTSCAPPANRWHDLAAECTVAQVSTSAFNAPQEELLRLDTDWFAPALRDLDSGRIPALHLRIGGLAWRVGRRRWVHALRRARPWHERLVR